MTGWGPAPDAGDSYLSHYGLTNPWTVWLLNQDAMFLAETPSGRRARRQAPLCPGDHWNAERPLMLWRPGAWKCYGHAEPVVVPIELAIEAAPEGDVLSRTGEMLDWVWSDAQQRYVIEGLAL